MLISSLHLVEKQQINGNTWPVYKIMNEEMKWIDSILTLVP